MRRPIFVKTLTGFLIVIVTLAILILVISYDNIRSHYIKTTAQNLENIGIPLQQIILPIFIKKDATSLETMAEGVYVHLYFPQSGFLGPTQEL